MAGVLMDYHGSSVSATLLSGYAQATKLLSSILCPLSSDPPIPPVFDTFYIPALEEYESRRLLSYLYPCGSMIAGMTFPFIKTT